MNRRLDASFHLCRSYIITLHVAVHIDGWSEQRTLYLPVPTCDLSIDAYLLLVWPFTTGPIGGVPTLESDPLRYQFERSRRWEWVNYRTRVIIQTVGRCCCLLSSSAQWPNGNAPPNITRTGIFVTQVARTISHFPPRCMLTLTLALWRSAIQLCRTVFKSNDIMH